MAKAKKAKPTSTPTVARAPQRAQIATVAYDAIVRWESQPRVTFDPAALEELAASIAERGLEQPLLLRDIDAEMPGTKFQIVDGERRWRALGLLIARGAWAEDDPVPALILKNVTDSEALLLAIVANLQRVDPNPMEEARALAALHAQDPESYTTAYIAKEIGKTTRYVEQRLALVSTATKELQKAVEKGNVGIAFARQIAPLPKDLQEEMLSEIDDGEIRTEDDLRRAVEHERMDAKNAIFDLAPHADRIIEPKKGERFFVGRARFIELQKAAAKEKVKDLRKEWAWAELQENWGTHLNNRWNYEEKHSADRTKAGAIVVFASNSGEVQVTTGLVKKKQESATGSLPDSEADEHEQRRVERAAAITVLQTALRQAIIREPLLARRVEMMDMALANRDFIAADLYLTLSPSWSLDELEEGGLLAPFKDVLGPCATSEEPSTEDLRALWGRLADWNPITRDHIAAALVAVRLDVEDECYLQHGSDETATIDPILVALCRDANIAIPAPLLPKPEKPKKGKKAKALSAADPGVQAAARVTGSTPEEVAASLAAAAPQDRGVTVTEVHGPEDLTDLNRTLEARKEIREEEEADTALLDIPAHLRRAQAEA